MVGELGGIVIHLVKFQIENLTVVPNSAEVQKPIFLRKVKNENNLKLLF